MKQKMLILVLMAAFPVIAGPVDYVIKVIKASALMNDGWLETCLQVAESKQNIAHCKKVHSLFDKAIKDSLR